MITNNRNKQSLKEIDNLPSNWAAWLQHKGEQLSIKVKVIFLLVFCFLASTLSIYLIADSLLSRKSFSLILTPIKQPEYTGLYGAESTKASAIISEAEYQKIHGFRLYLDSLAKSTSGKAFHDSILHQRPGLMDSIQFIENIYQVSK